MTRGLKITREAGENLAKRHRKQRFGYERERVARRPVSTYGSVRHFRTPGGGLPAFNPTTKLLGTALCRRWDCSDNDTLVDSGTDEAVYNPFGALPGSIFILVAENELGLSIALPPAFDVRLKPDGSALEKSYDGGITWTTFATIGECG